MSPRRRRQRGRPRLLFAALLAALVVSLTGSALAAPHDPLRSRNGSIEFHAHVFPVQGPHGERGAIGEFGAPRSGGRVHEGFDILARCGTEVVAAATGKVRFVGYDPILYGNYMLQHAEGEHHTYMYAHLKKPPLVHEGERVYAGERIAAVGKTGNARSVGCQLHFEIHVDGRPIDPKPALEHWDASS